MAKEFNEEKIRSELINLYKEFIKQPQNEKIRSELIKFDRDFGGLAAYNDYLKSRPIPEYLSKAIGHVSTIYQYGLGTYEDDKIYQTAREILESLEHANKAA